MILLLSRALNKFLETLLWNWLVRVELVQRRIIRLICHSIRSFFYFRSCIQHLEKFCDLHGVGHGALNVTSSIEVPLVYRSLTIRHNFWYLHSLSSERIIFRFVPVDGVRVAAVIQGWLELRLTWFFLRQWEVWVLILAVFDLLEFLVVVLTVVAVLALLQLCVWPHIFMYALRGSVEFLSYSLKFLTVIRF